MVRGAPEAVKYNMVNSGCTSMSGGRVNDVNNRVQAETVKMREEGLLIIKEGGSRLVQTGYEETVKEIMEVVETAEGKRMSDWRAEATEKRTPVLRIAKENDQEDGRRTCEAEDRKKIKQIGNVIFIEMDSALEEDKLYAREGVHLNARDI